MFSLSNKFSHNRSCEPALSTMMVPVGYTTTRMDYSGSSELRTTDCKQAREKHSIRLESDSPRTYIMNLREIGAEETPQP